MGRHKVIQCGGRLELVMNMQVWNGGGLGPREPGSYAELGLNAAVIQHSLIIAAHLKEEAAIKHRARGGRDLHLRPGFSNPTCPHKWHN
jgi:hypothetical protein